MADFRKTGDYLWRKYNGAIQVVMNQDGTGFTVANKRFKKPTKNDLVYFENSPDYCIRDRDAGKFKTLYSQYLILSPIHTPQLQCSPGCAAWQFRKCSQLPSRSTSCSAQWYVSVWRAFLGNWRNGLIMCRFWRKVNPRRYMAKSQNMQISQILQPGRNSNAHSLWTATGVSAVIPKPRGVELGHAPSPLQIPPLWLWKRGPGL